MANDSRNVDVGETGAVAYAPVGAAAPVDAETALVGYDEVGYLSDDGVSEARDRSTNNIVAWQGSDVVRTTVTEASITVGFTMIETKKETVELFYGSSLDEGNGSVDIRPGTTGGRRAIVADYIDGDKYVRMYIPQGEVTEVGEVTVANSDAVGYEVTVMGYPSPALEGASARKFYSALVVETP